MKHTYLFLLLLFLLPNPIDGQVSRKAVMMDKHRRFNKGDTVNVLASYSKYGYSLYVVTNGERTEETPSSKISIIGDSLTFWEDIWFKSKSYSAFDRKVKVPNAYQKQKSLDILLSLQEQNKIYEDPFVEDYLLQKLILIRPPHEFFGKDSSHFNLKLLNQPSEEIIVLPNKTILVSVDWLAGTSTADEVIMALNKAVIYAFLGYHLDYYKSEPAYEEESEDLSDLLSGTKQKLRVHATRLFKEQKRQDIFNEQVPYLNVISGIITYVAWQEYYNQNYEKSIDLLNKVIDNGFATDEEFFLKAKIYRQLYNSPEKNQEALSHINKAMDINTFRFPELMQEKGLILFRLNRYSEAKTAFEKYLESLTEASGDPQKIKWCRAMIKKCETTARLMTN
jgi:tetratricopeptide (TPR) repeat protein